MRGIIVLPVVLIWTIFCGILGIVMRILIPADQCVKIIAYNLWAPVIFFLFGIKFTCEFEEELPKVPSIYIANHLSQLDIAALVGSIPKGLFFVAKKELSYIPLLAQYMKVMGMIFVDRGNREKAIQSMEEAADKVSKGKNLVTFPEGTRSTTGQLLSFKKGSFVIAQKRNIPIVPIAIFGADKALKKGSFWVKPHPIHVHIGKAITLEEYQGITPGELAEYSRNRIQSYLDKYTPTAK
jgi:1-acyl-sn-glycerol-3-phosphate acyltransferase